MPTISTCPHCDKKLRTPEDGEGRKLRCPGCKATLIITEDGLAPAEDEEARPRKGRAAARADDEDEPPRRSRRRDEDDDYDDAPRRSRRRSDDEEDDRPRRRSRRRSGGGIPMWVWLTGGGVLAGGLVILLLVLLLGGGSKFGKIKEGMTAKEVTDILGEPTDGDLKFIATWYYPPLKKADAMNFEKIARVKEALIVTFHDGKVQHVQWLKVSDLQKKFMK